MTVGQSNALAGDYIKELINSADLVATVKIEKTGGGMVSGDAVQRYAFATVERIYKGPEKDAPKKVVLRYHRNPEIDETGDSTVKFEDEFVFADKTYLVFVNRDEDYDRDGYQAYRAQDIFLGINSTEHHITKRILAQLRFAEFVLRSENKRKQSKDRETKSK